MSQYQVGTVEVTQGNALVTAVDPDSPDVLASQEWLNEVNQGDLFYVAGDAVTYVVDTVNSDTSLTLTSTYQGTTVTASGTPLAGASYAIHRDFSDNYAFPITSQGDIGIPVLVKLVTLYLDLYLKQIDDRVTALEP